MIEIYESLEKRAFGFDMLDGMKPVNEGEEGSESEEESDHVEKGNVKKKKKPKLKSELKLSGAVKTGVADQIRSFRTMFLSLEHQIKDLQARRTADEEIEKMIELHATDESPIDKTPREHSARGSSVNSREFQGVKKLLAKHQNAILQFEGAIKDFDQMRIESDYGKLYDMNESNFKMLKAYIEQVNEFYDKMYRDLEKSVKKKADANYVTDFKDKVERNVMEGLRSKISKAEHIKHQYFMRSKLSSLH